MKIFLDSGIPEETKKAIDLLGHLDGQTTNPSLVAKHPKFALCKSEEDAWKIYKEIVLDISGQIPKGSVSIEVYADSQTSAEEMVKKGRELNSWIPNAHIKLPITNQGLAAAKILVGENIRVNMTLCFSQEQAAAVYAATKGAKKGDVFVSPFVGRLDDQGQNGMSLIENIMNMYKTGDGHVEVLVASLRHYEHLKRTLQLGADIATCPLKLIQEWAEDKMKLPEEDYKYECSDKQNIEYKNISLEQNWENFDIYHPLTEAGLKKFVEDWKLSIKN